MRSMEMIYELFFRKKGLIQFLEISYEIYSVFGKFTLDLFCEK